MGERAEITAEHLELVRDTASRVRNRLPDEIELDDLIQDGWFGLRNALNGFDPARGVKFNTYARLRIRGAILDGLRDRDWVPRLVRIRKETPVAVQSTGDQAFFDEGERGNLLENTLADDSQPIALGLDERDSIEAILRVLPTRRHRLMCRMYFVGDVTMKAIGVAIGLSESRVSQMMSEAVRIMQGNIDRDLDDPRSYRIRNLIRALEVGEPEPAVGGASCPDDVPERGIDDLAAEQRRKLSQIAANVGGAVPLVEFEPGAAAALTPAEQRFKQAQDDAAVARAYQQKTQQTLNPPERMDPMPRKTNDSLWISDDFPGESFTRDQLRMKFGLKSSTLSVQLSPSGSKRLAGHLFRKSGETAAANPATPPPKRKYTRRAAAEKGVGRSVKSPAVDVQDIRQRFRLELDAAIEKANAEFTKRMQLCDELEKSLATSA